MTSEFKLKDSTAKTSSPTVKVYVVFQRLFAVRDGRPNVRIVDVRTSRAEAEAVVRAIPATFIQKVVATKGGRHPRYANGSHLGDKHHGNQSTRPAHHQTQKPSRR